MNRYLSFIAFIGTLMIGFVGNNVFADNEADTQFAIEDLKITLNAETIIEIPQLPIIFKGITFQYDEYSRYFEEGLEIDLYLVLDTNEDGNEVFYTFDTEAELEEHQPNIEDNRSSRRSYGVERLLAVRFYPWGARTLRPGQCSRYYVYGVFHNGRWTKYRRIDVRWSFDPNMLQVSPFLGGAKVCARYINGERYTSLIASNNGIVAKRYVGIR